MHIHVSKSSSGSELLHKHTHIHEIRSHSLDSTKILHIKMMKWKEEKEQMERVANNSSSHTATAHHTENSTRLKNYKNNSNIFLYYERKEQRANNEHGKMWKICFFPSSSSSSFLSAAVAVALQKTKICIIERLLSGSLLFRIQSHFWWERFVRVYVCCSIRTAFTSRCICVGQMCARSLQSSMFLMKFVLAFCCAVCCVVLPRQDCKQTLVYWMDVFVACSIGRSFRFTIRLLPGYLKRPLILVCLCFVWSLSTSVSVEFHFILQCFKNTHSLFTFALVRSPGPKHRTK